MPGFNLRELLERGAPRKFALHERLLNGQLVRVLRTIGFDRQYVSGQGAHLYDADGNRYLDLLSGFGVFGIGRNHPTVKDALAQVLAADLPNLVQLDVSVLSGLLAERLLKLMPGLDKMFFCSSGAEAVEAALKFARFATGRQRIVYCEHAFHGLTYGALSVNGDDEFRSGFEPMIPDCRAVPFNDLAALEAALANRDVAAFIVEPIQGKGVNLPADDYLPEAARLCRKYGTLFVADEVQTGMGRTGRFLALEHWNVEADMVLLAKALSGGHVPVGAVGLKRWIFDRVFDRMDRAVVHGSTFSKTDLAMAAGLATLSVIEDERLIERARLRGAELLADFEEIQARHEMLIDVRGKGLMIGLEFGCPDSLKMRIAWRMLDQLEKGLFCQMLIMPLFARHRVIAQVAGHRMPVIKLLPPYVISDEDRVWIRDAFDAVLADCRSVRSSVLPMMRDLAAGAMLGRAKAG
ncbi:MAG TPA: aspartate aminotransferase family protein [Alphaproteobacteria bacterium]|nr:aspartate aminotransferase family protein [Alphaproteobacteria bacterium]